MEKEKIEETIENPTEEETVDEKETSTEDQETSKEPETPEEEKMIPKSQVDRLYKRLKDKEEDYKDLKEEFEKAKKSTSDKIDFVELSEEMSAFSGLASEERKRLAQEAKLQKSPLGDARKSQEFNDWLVGQRARKEKEKIAKPSTKQPITITEKPWEQMSSDEKVDWIKGVKIMNPKTGKYEPAQLLPRAYYKKK